MRNGRGEGEVPWAPFALPAFGWPATEARQGRRGGGAGGIRTLDRALQPYNGLANRRLQPLGHSSMCADMPDARASRKRQIQITPRPFRGTGALRVLLASGRYP